MRLESTRDQTHLLRLIICMESSSPMVVTSVRRQMPAFAGFPAEPPDLEELLRHQVGRRRGICGAGGIHGQDRLSACCAGGTHRSPAVATRRSLPRTGAWFFDGCEYRDNGIPSKSETDGYFNMDVPAAVERSDKSRVPGSGVTEGLG